MSKKLYPQTIELLAPAKDAVTAIDAINCGADAVYMGASKFGARALAGNDVAELGKVAEFAHNFNARLYATVNTIIYEHELKEVERLIKQLYNVGVDALIVQDMGILRLDIPPIELHSSTQCDLRNPEKAKFLGSVGFSQLVLARELSLPEIKAIHDATDAKLEAFVYGALCVSYSGRCQISEALKGRSANRGECAQICRMPYDLVDEAGNIIVGNCHLLSLKDMNQSLNLEEMMNAGISSFKIEGRLKDVNYVRNSVSYFRREIDRIISKNNKFTRSSNGQSSCEFEPSLEKCFNRSFTHYFMNDRHPANAKMATLITPKSLGEKIGKVISSKGIKIKVDSPIKINNGDGLSYFNGKEFTGFRANKVENGIIHANANVFIPSNTLLYRTYNKEHDSNINKSKINRRVAVDFILRNLGNLLILDLNDEMGNCVTTTMLVDSLEEAKSDQRERQKETLSKLGNTTFYIRKCDIEANVFIPASTLTTIRRNAIDLLKSAQRITYKFGERKVEEMDLPYFADTLISSDNVANSMSERFYNDHGVKYIEKAIEVTHKYDNSTPLMHTRYCIRRELGACRKSSNCKTLPEKIFLKLGQTLLCVDCNCETCEMQIKISKR